MGNFIRKRMFGNKLLLADAKTIEMSRNNRNER